MVEVYATLVNAGVRTLASVPTALRAAVEARVAEKQQAA